MLTVLRQQNSEPVAASVCRVATGRSAILHLIKRWQPDAVFLPSIVPDGIMQPVANRRCALHFYALNEELAPDLADLAFQLEYKKARRPLIIGIQYFGFAMNFAPMQKISGEYGGLLLADCAHVIAPRASAYADVVLHSLNKFLPVPDGAVMYSLNRALDLSIPDILEPMPEETLAAYREHLAINAAFDDAIPEDVDELLDASRRRYDDYYDYISGLELHRQSEESIRAESIADFGRMANARWARSSILRERLDPALLVRDENAQFAFPIRCHGRRKEMETALLACGVVAARLHDKWLEIGDRGFLDDHLLLPLNEKTTTESLASMADALNRVLK